MKTPPTLPAPHFQPLFRRSGSLSPAQIAPDDFADKENSPKNSIGPQSCFRQLCVSVQKSLSRLSIVEEAAQVNSQVDFGQISSDYDPGADYPKSNIASSLNSSLSRRHKSTSHRSERTSIASSMVSSITSISSAREVGGTISSKANPRVSQFSIKQGLHAFKRLIKYDHVLKIADASVIEGNGPWNDSVETSPIPTWQLDVATLDEKAVVHVMTIGKATVDLDTQEEFRRIKIYEHHIDMPNVEALSKTLVSEPTEALMVIHPILSSPESQYKLSDRILSKADAIEALSLAQISLIPLFGTWLNGLLCPELDVKASSTRIYLCGYSPDSGTVARVLKPLEPHSGREHVSSHLAHMLSSVLETYWDTHPLDGFSLAVVVPPGEKDGKVFA
ncbi:hypothetical protein BCR33DRAFT_855726 [Rhizoclosmatium globosum]|uniref:Uncharacterized protein n=1 Tax=Rhizoclosmatium globosum TaxID=329046 RepID=A0A1Y2BKF9_9FUNG|nr:hypothetical protein BCR33DRAFT_855726 [Rhizoclosmatium globosum]|eukprot:ORY35256.1 hypothetical protein BCR33DRAFT_855726 [Rhizoclosmatium globosum]